MLLLRRPLLVLISLATGLGLVLPATTMAHSGVRNIVVIYEENHSFDNLYGGWEGVNGLDRADRAHTEQRAQDGTPYPCLAQDDVNLTSPPLPAGCQFPNEPFAIDDFISPMDTTCPAPGVFAVNGVSKGSGLPGGCTRDLVHRYYQEQYQLDGGRQDRYVTGSDALGLTMGHYDTTALPIYRYLHAHGHPPYAIADDFFQAAFGGSFLNHQWLVAAATPTWPGATNDGSGADLHSVVDANGMPTSYPLYASPAATSVKDQALTASCAPGPGRGPTPPGVTCGDYAVNTIQPPYQPYAPGTVAARRLPPQTAPTIGNRLSAEGIDWAWYSGGWSNAAGDVGAPGWTNGDGPTCSDPDTAGGAGNEHPGYASVSTGSDHLVDLLSAIETSRCAKRTLVIVTYDEFGGAWDHVPPPGQGATSGPHDKWGPGTRIPALVVSSRLRRRFSVDHTRYDTTSILATIERRFGVAPLGPRDAAVNDLLLGPRRR